MNFYLKMSRNLESNFLDFWQFLLATFWHSREQLFSNAQLGQTSLVEHCTTSGCNSCTGLNFSFQVFLLLLRKFALKLFSFILIRISHTRFSYIQSKLKKKYHIHREKKRRKELVTRCLQCSESILNVHISNARLNIRYWTYRDARGMCQ